MRVAIRLIFLMYLSVHLCAARAQDAVDLFASELLQLESRQLLRPADVLRYTDTSYGDALRKVLNPERAQQVLPVYFEKLKSSRGTDPDVAVLLKPLFVRYEKAFGGDPRGYETEYLDALNWSINIILQSTSTVNELPKAEPLKNGEKPIDMAPLMDSLKGLMSSMQSLIAKGIRDKVALGVFSPEGAKRATQYADSLAPAVPPPPLYRTRALATGEAVYRDQCVVCHASGVAGSPKLGDIRAWEPRLKTGFESLLRSTLKGKGAMGMQSGGDYLDAELARAVAYMANASGGRFPQPPLPPGHPETVLVRIPPPPMPPPAYLSIPYANMSFDDRLRYGERVFEANCAVCHQINGRGVGQVIPPLANSKSFASNEASIAVLLKGQRGGAMPSWGRLSDVEIAVVINYIRDKFGNDLFEHVTPEGVRVRR